MPPRPITVDLSGKTIIVTGATSGIGKEAARNLARMGARVILACRNEAKGQAVQDEIGGQTELAIVDLSSQASIRWFADHILERCPRIDVLLNNAGCWPTEKSLTVDGYELTFATNVLGYFLVTNLLQERLIASAPARIVDVASSFASDLDIDDLMFERRPFSGALAYKQSKQSNRMLAWVRADKLRGTGVTVNAVHPGPVNTDLSREFSGLKGTVMRNFFKHFGRTVEHGADTSTYVAASPDVENVTSQFWVNRKQKPCGFRDQAAMARLWARCDELTKAK